MLFLIVIAVNLVNVLDVSGQEIIDKVYIRQQVEVKLPNGSEMKSSMELFINNNQVRMESRQGPMSSITLYSEARKSSVLLTDINGNKEGKVTYDSLNNDDNVKVEYSEETNTILNTPCKKAILKTTIDNKTTEEIVVWYAQKLKLPFNYNFGIKGLNKIEGFPMEYEYVRMGIKMTHRVVEMDFKKNMEDAIFQIPEGYKFK